MDNRTKRDVSFLNLVNNFETNFESGNPILHDEDTFLKIIRFYEEEFQYEKAIEVADIAIQQLNFRPDFYIIKARLLFQLNIHEDALELLERAEKISPYEHDILLLKIRILAFQGRIEDAQDILLNLKKYVNQSDLSDLYLSESFINEAQHDYQKMYDNLTKAVISDWKNEEAIERLGFAVQLCKNFEQSIEFHKMVLNSNAYNYLGWYNIGHAYACQGEYSKAISALEYSFISQENFQNGYLDCADICIQEKEYAKALSIYDSYVSQFGVDEEVLFNMAECQYQLDDLNKARIILNKLLKLDPYNDEVYFKLGLCYMKAEKWNKAVNVFHKAITLEDNSEDYFLHLAHAYNALGSYDKAELFYGNAVEIGPEQSVYWREYIAFLIKIGKTEDALDVFYQADDFTFGADLLYCKGVAEWVSGNKSEAYNTIEEALKEDYDLHPLIYMIEPEMELDKSLLSMISYYKEE